jgi:GrpB-like predicted nucleotidyltransferase (UPF0157 family)
MCDDPDRDELGRRFPIFLVEYDPQWPELYEAEAQLLGEQFGDIIVRTEHIGSTAVPGIAAKPTIDILVEITSFENAKREIVPVLMAQGIGYGYPSGPPPGHMAFWKGYYPETTIKYHYHMAPAGHPLMDRVFFRDYLRKYPETAKEYERLKYHLAEIHLNDREAYTDAKTDFIVEITERAKKELSTAT